MFDFCVFSNTKSWHKFHFFQRENVCFYWKYIINYAIKKNCNQYQKIMKFAFICKTRINVVNNFNNESNSNNFVRIADIEKFGLRIYNWFAHDREINNFFIANCLRKLSKDYIFCKKMKNFFLNVCRRIFTFIWFLNFVDTSNELIRFKKFKSLFEIMYNHYRWKRLFLNKYLLYDYLKYVNIINVNNQKFIGIVFNNCPLFSKFIKQQSLLLSIVNYFIFLYNSLSTDKIVENVIHNNHSKTNVR